jgi:photosystem II stability/assembly factor-like uncharacterized protein
MLGRKYGVATLAIFLLWALPVSAGINQWTSNGPYGADATIIAIDPSIQTTLYTVTWSSGIFKSTNGGESWFKTGLTTYPIQGFVIDPCNSSILYASSSMSPGGIYKSSNGGDSWSKIDVGLNNASVSALAIDPNTSSTLYASGGGGVFKSTNGGDSWNQGTPNISSSAIVTLAIDPVTSTIIYAGSYGGGVYKSTDGGDSWSQINTGLTNTIISALAINPVTPTTLYVITNAGLFKSTDGGSNWHPIVNDLLKAGIVTLAMDPATSGTLYASVPQGGLLKSEDEGMTWVQISSTPFNDYIHTMAVAASSPKTIYAGMSGNDLLKSTDGGASWNYIDKGLYPLPVSAVAVDPITPTTVYAASSRIYKSTDSGSNWVLNDLEQIKAITFDPSTPTNLYAVQTAGIFKSTNNWDSWLKISSGLTDLSIQAFAIAPTDPLTLYAGTASAGVYKSTNGGNSWSPANAGMSNISVQALAVDPITPTTIYAGTSSGGVYKSMDGGETWRQSNTGLYPYVLALAIDPTAPDTLYAGTSGGVVFKSTNGGSNWFSVGNGLQNSYFRTLAIDKNKSSTLYAGSSDGVFMSINGGASWYNINSGLTSSDVYSLAVASTIPSTLYAGTYGGGLIAMQIVTTTATPHSGTYSTLQNVILATSIPTTIYYTTDGTDPVTSTSRQTYTDPIPMNLATVLKFYSVDAAGNTEPVKTETYSFSSIIGRVTDRTSGVGIPQTYVTVYNSITGSPIKTIQTDDKGAYSIEGLSSGSYKIYFCKEGYILRWYGDKPDIASAVAVTVTAPSTTSGIDVALVKFGGISGRVIDAVSGVGLPGVTVTVRDGIGSTTTDANGAYLISGLLNKDYKVEFSKFGYATQLYNNKSDISLATLVAVTPPSTTTGVDAVLRKTGTITGRVTDSITGAGVQGISIDVYDATGNRAHNYGNTDVDGAYSVNGVVEGRYKISFSSNYYVAQWYANKPDMASAIEVAVVSGATTQSIDAVVVKKGGISGRVTDSATGQGIGMMYVEFCQRPAGTLMCGNAFTDSSGNYNVNGITEGTYKVRFYGNYYLLQWYGNKSDFDSATPITISNGVTSTGINAAMIKGGSISGRITDKVTGAGVPNVAAAVYDNTTTSTTFLANDYSDYNGFYTISGLSPGQYKVIFGGGGYVLQWYDTGPDRAHATAVTVTAATTTTGINAALGKTGSISGRVTDGTNGLGIQGVTVEAYDGLTGLFVGYTYTDGTGAFSVTWLNTGSYKLRIAIAGYLEQWYTGKAGKASATGIDVTAPNTTSGINVTLAIGASITGTVTDSATGAGIQYMSVTAYNAVNGSSAGYGYTDSSGSYSIIGLATGSYKLRFSGSGYIDQWFSGKADQTTATPVSVTAPNTTSGINVALAKGGSISGTVSDSVSGAAIQGVSVTAVDAATGSSISSASSDSSGGYRIVGLAGSYKLRFSGSGYVERWYSGKADLTGATIVSVTAPDATSGINMAMVKGGLITGIVTDGTTGEGIQGAYIDVYNAVTGSWAGSGSTDSSGSYGITGLATGNYKLVLSGTGYIRQWFDGKADQTTATSVSVTAPNTVSSINIALVKGGSITGTITDRATGAGIGNTYLYVIDRSTGDWAGSASTDSNGNYTITGLASGSYRMKINPSSSTGYLGVWYGGQDGYQCANAITVSAPNATTGIDVGLDMGGSISGRVTDAATGLGISGANISLMNNSTHAGIIMPSTIVDSTGAYTISGLPSGDYSLSFSAPDYVRTTSPATITVTAPAGVTGVDASLARGGGISGRVTDSATAAGIGDVWVDARDSGTGMWLGSDISDVNGDYQITGLPSGSYAILFNGRDSGYTNGWYSGQPGGSVATPVTVVAPVVTTGINRSLARIGAISGLVTDSASAEPLDWVSVTAYDNVTGAWSGSTMTNSDGTYKISGLPTGNYRIQFMSTSLAIGPYPGTGYVSWIASDVAVLSPATTSGIDARLVKGGAIAGLISVSSCPGPRRVNIMVYDAASGNLVGQTWVDTSYTERFTIGALPTGSYKLAINPGEAGFVRQWYPNKTDAASAEPVTVVAGATTGGIVVQLAAGGGSISGKATWSNGRVYNPVSVKLYDWSTGGLVVESTASFDGSYLLTGLPDASYKLLFSFTQLDRWYRTTGETGQASPIVVSGGGSVTGIDLAASDVPIVTNDAAAISPTGEILYGMVNSNGADTTVTFAYGPTTGYGSSVSGGTVAAGSGSAAVSATITGLACGTSYHYRVVGVSSSATTYGLDQTFTTTECPVNGVCGSSSGGVFAVAPATGLCSPDAAETLTSVASGWTWSCPGSKGGASVSCAANRTPDNIIHTDFSGSGHSDILWRNTATGQLSLWYLNGIDRNGQPALLPDSSPDQNWKIVATHDFNADGKPDILWQNSSSGDVSIWHMDNTAKLDGDYIIPTNYGDLAWKIYATGRLTGGASPDILWQNRTTGELALWQMNDTVRTAVIPIIHAVTDLNWEIVAIDDFKGPTGTDILWQNKVTGDIAIWNMNHADHTGYTLPSPVNIGDLAWKAIGTGDYNNDGNTDLLWKNTITGDLKVWYMNGAAMIGSVAINPANYGDALWTSGNGNRMTTAITADFNGGCGASNGGLFTAAPTAGLCSAGTASAVTGSGSWSWTCAGGGGTTANCSADLLRSGIVNPAPGKTRPDLSDALRTLGIATGSIPPTATDYAQLDVAPLDGSGRPHGDSVIDTYDVIGLLRMVVGLL